MYIEELKRELTGRDLAIWNGTSGLSPEKEEKYRQRWREQSLNPGLVYREKPPVATKSFDAKAVLSPDCPHRSKEPTGEVVPCSGCTGVHQVELYDCSHFNSKCHNGPYHPKGSKSCVQCDVPRVAKFLADKAAKAAKLISPPPKSHPALEMVAPRDRRQVWRGGVLQIWVTRACDRSCYACTQGSNLAGKPGFITVEQFRLACESLKDYFGVVGMFGGNPVLHPQFDELCAIMRDTIPWEQRGLWCNHPKGKGKTAAITFNPKYSNLNVHESKQAWDEFERDWPECSPYLKGLDGDSRHSPPFVAMNDLIPEPEKRWELIKTCDINKNWSALIGVFRDQPRGWFCEIAAAQAMLHQDEPDYPDTGVPITPGWWNQGMEAFVHQAEKHCHECGIPLRGYGSLANAGPVEQVSATHFNIYTPKRDRNVERVTELIQLGKPITRVTDYLENGRAPTANA